MKLLALQAVINMAVDVLIPRMPEIGDNWGDYQSWMELYGFLDIPEIKVIIKADDFVFVQPLLD